MGSLLASRFSPSTSLGRSDGFLASTATRTTGDTLNFITWQEERGRERGVGGEREGGEEGRKGERKGWKGGRHMKKVESGRGEESRRKERVGEGNARRKGGE